MAFEPNERITLEDALDKLKFKLEKVILLKFDLPIVQFSFKYYYFLKIR